MCHTANLSVYVCLHCQWIYHFVGCGNIMPHARATHIAFNSIRGWSEIPPQGEGVYACGCVCVCVSHAWQDVCQDLNIFKAVQTLKVEAIWSWTSSEYIYIHLTLHVIHKRWGNNCFNKSFMMGKLHLTNPFVPPPHIFIFFIWGTLLHNSSSQLNDDIAVISGCCFCVSETMWMILAVLHCSMYTLFRV